MKKLLSIVTVTLVTLGITSFASAYSTGFEASEGINMGTYNSITLPWVEFTNNMGNLNVVDAIPGPDLSGQQSVIGANIHLPEERNIAKFLVGNIHSVSVAMGDYDSDEDLLHLEAYNSAGALLASDSKILPDYVYGGPTLFVSSPHEIAYAKFYSEGVFPGSYYFDNFKATTNVPEPASMMLLGSGLLGLIGFGKRSRKE